MVNDPVSFSGNTRFEVISVIANCGTDIGRAKRALVTYILHKQEKGRSTEHILSKLRDIESKFIKDTSLHPAFRDARAQTFLPRSPDVPLPGIPIPESQTSGRNHARPSVLDMNSINEALSSSSGSSSPGSTPWAVTPSISPSSYSASPRSPHRFGRTMNTHYEDQYTASRSYNPPSPQMSRSLPYPPGQASSSMAPVLTYSPTQLTAFGNLPPSPIHLQFPNRSRSISHPQPQPLVGRRSLPPLNRQPAPVAPLPPVPTDDQNPHPHPPTTGLLRDSPSTHTPTSPIHPASPASPGLPGRYGGNTLVHSLPPLGPMPTASDESDVSSTSTARRCVSRTLQIANPDPHSGPEIVTRGDSPLQGAYAMEGGKGSHAGTDPPPPYLVSPRTHFPVEFCATGSQLDRALKISGAPMVTRREVIRCLKSEAGYERPFWRIRLSECGLDTDVIDYLLQEMSREVDWIGRAL
ncbi:hypothetical protein HYDPIDRAFT_32528 [Hydnomerulius pinastri MD-312]|uniref:Uncharacterized protein n=1 Tax=Hydnomerulius pinastri MD-312 TaxID=994086 RepID=A0A0C9V405_9AGAM|nr:hypothetical protein HYDPIDRAFT_32528 [Hydnomerulius pinastri MD-312]